ncbi:hypothetical protein ACTA71_007844 [Dictyostelium dimigraforme]
MDSIRLQLFKQDEAFNTLLETRGFKQIFRVENPLELGNVLSFTDSTTEPNVLFLFDTISCDISIFTINLEILDKVLERIDFSIGFLTPYKNEINYQNIKYKTPSFDSHFKHSETLTFKAVPLDIEEIILKYLKKYYNTLRNNFGIFDSFYLPIDNKEEIIAKLNENIDENVSILTVEDSEYVNNNWPYRSDESIHFIKWACSQEVSASYRIKNEETGEKELVSWILMYPDASIGSLFSDPKYRGKGFARKVSSLIILKKLRSQPTQLPYLFIKTDNVPSQSLMRSLGFKTDTQVKWIVCSNK